MANVMYGRLIWFSGGENNDMAPGERHGFFIGLQYGDALSISPLPVVAGSRYLVVEDLVYESNSDLEPPWRVNFFVRNAGSSFITAYIVGYSITRE